MIIKVRRQFAGRAKTKRADWQDAIRQCDGHTVGEALAAVTPGGRRVRFGDLNWARKQGLIELVSPERITAGSAAGRTRSTRQNRWQTADAKQQFTSLIAQAENEGAQVVMRHSKPVAVVLSAADFRRLAKQADESFARLLSESPFEPEDLRGMTMRLRGDA
jgi:prevent-host-death family protein